MSIPATGGVTLRESSISSAGPWGRIPNSWAQIKSDDALVGNAARAHIQRQISSVIRDNPHPWKTVGLTPQSVETVVMDVLQQELDDLRHSAWYRTACMKCLRVLSTTRNIVPSSIFLRDVTTEGRHPVALGGFADIWKGNSHGTQVCLKILRIVNPEEDQAKVLRDFCQEALVWRQLRHLNVLPFLGVGEELSPRYCLISPWVANGTIISYLKAHPDHDRVTSLVQIAQGMKYLHSLDPPIVHADICGANILVMDDLRCCLADFGLSLFAESQALESSYRMRKGSTRWLAPEYLNPHAVIDRTYITARDTYAYGCTVIEIYTGKPPFSDSPWNEIVVSLMVTNGSRPPRPQRLLQDDLWRLVTMCLLASPSRRPTADQIARALADLCREEEEGKITVSKGTYYAISNGLLLGWVVLVNNGNVEALLNLLYAYLGLQTAVIEIFTTCLVSVVSLLTSSYDYWLFLSLFFLLSNVNIVEYAHS